MSSRRSAQILAPEASPSQRSRLLMAMIEIPEAVENANAIAAVDGIDVPKPTLVSGTTVSPAGSGKRLGSRSDSKVPTMWPLPPEVLYV